MIVVDQKGVECAVATEVTGTEVTGTQATGTQAIGAATGGEQVFVRWHSGEQALLPRDLLQRQEDGRYQLAYSLQRVLAEYGNSVPANAADSQTQVAAGHGVGNLETEQELVVPIVEEQVVVETRPVETGRLQIQKSVQERVELVDQPLFEEEVQIERVPVNRPITEAVTPHYVEDTLIIPLVEEVLVVQKQLVLREEIHIRKVRKESHETQEVRLRTEVVNVVRLPEAGGATDPEAVENSR
jgi:uncharacterized protein (TIGR02271 family)